LYKIIYKFEYDALGRRTKKIANGKIYRYLWQENVLLHEWSYKTTDEPQLQVDDLGQLSYDKPEPIDNLVTWVYEEGSFVPSAKIVENETISIINDYIGRPVQAYSSDGNIIWQTDYDIYGNLISLQGDRSLIPFRQLGQYEDVETGLYYNRFRYYSPETGTYISQDPIGLLGNNPNFYAYVGDSNKQIDPLGLSSNSALLGSNLGASPGSNHAAHHIVMTGTQDANMNSLVSQMQTHGINQDGKNNGIWLPVRDSDKISGFADTSHQQDGLHGKNYKDEIFNRLDGKNKKDFKKELAKIKRELKNGRTWETRTTKKLGKVCR
jgi:RHS repeat-associated protein